MPSIKKTKVVSYTSQQMYSLVNDVNRYAEFVPWCVKSDIISATETEIKACLGFSRGGVSQSFTTVNRLQPHKMIEIRLLEGPFRHLEGFWQFDELAEQQSRVSLDIEFEFSTKFLSVVFGPVFNQIASTLVASFCERATAIYHD